MKVSVANNDWINALLRCFFLIFNCFKRVCVTRNYTMEAIQRWAHLDKVQACWSHCWNISITNIPHMCCYFINSGILYRCYISRLIHKRSDTETFNILCGQVINSHYFGNVDVGKQQHKVCLANSKSILGCLNLHLLLKFTPETHCSFISCKVNLCM